jgi:hypothetical protein
MFVLFYVRGVSVAIRLAWRPVAGVSVVSVSILLQNQINQGMGLLAFNLYCIHVLTSSLVVAGVVL